MLDQRSSLGAPEIGSRRGGGSDWAAAAARELVPLSFFPPLSPPGAALSLLDGSARPPSLLCAVIPSVHASSLRSRVPTAAAVAYASAAYFGRAFLRVPSKGICIGVVGDLLIRLPICVGVAGDHLFVRVFCVGAAVELFCNLLIVSVVGDLPSALFFCACVAGDLFSTRPVLLLGRRRRPLFCPPPPRTSGNQCCCSL